MKSLLPALLLLSSLAPSADASPWTPLAPEWKTFCGEIDHLEPPASSAAFDDSAWTAATPAQTVIPGASTGTTVWLRQSFALPAGLAGRSLLLHLGAADPFAEIYCNGAKVAPGRDAAGRPVSILPALLLHCGEPNLLAVKFTATADVAPLQQPGWAPLAGELPGLFTAAAAAHQRLAPRLAGLDPATENFLLAGLQPADFAQLQADYAAQPTDQLAAEVATRWRELHETEQNLDRRLQETTLLRVGDRLGFMRNEQLYQVRDFAGTALRRPTLGSELSDFGSWYDIAYSGGPGRFFLGSVRQGVGPDHEFFNTPRDVAQFALFLETSPGRLVGADDHASAVTWLPFGWSTITAADGLELTATTFFSAFNTLTVHGRIRNTGTQPRTVQPALLATLRSNYEDGTGGQVAGTVEPGGIVTLRNTRTGPRTTPALYTDTVAIATGGTPAAPTFAARYFPNARDAELEAAAAENATATTLAAPEGSAIIRSRALTLAPGGTAEFSYILAAAGETPDAVHACAAAAQTSPAAALAHVRQDWSDFLAALPALDEPTYENTKLYFASAIALRKNRWIRPQDGRLHSASFPARGGFNYFYQSDSCWNLLGYLDFQPDWARGHAVPILVPTCEIMDPHFFWSMWEVYSRLPAPAERHAFAEEVYPLLVEAYRHWTTRLDLDHDLLVATPNNWDDNPRYDLIFKEVKYAPGWNSWWYDLIACCRDHQLDDPAPSSQLGYGPIILERLARALGRTAEAEDWHRLIPAHQAAVNSLWDPALGYWIVTYRGRLRDEVLTSSIVYPLFTDLCRDPEQIRAVVERHLLNPAEFAGQFPVPTVAYDDPRFYRQKPPFEREPGGLWRGNIWMPETWLIVKGLFKYGYEREAAEFARRLLAMQTRQAGSVGRCRELSHSPSEWYDARTGLAQNNRAFSWSSAVALDYLLGNYQNERVVGTDAARDRRVHGHLRELFAFATGRSLLRVESGCTVFPLADLRTTDDLPIDRSACVELTFTDPAGNFAGRPVRCVVDPARWQICEADTGAVLPRDAAGACVVPIGHPVQLRAVARP